MKQKNKIKKIFSLILIFTFPINIFAGFISEYNKDSDGDGIPDYIEIEAKKLGDLRGDENDSQKKPFDYDLDGLPDIYEEKHSSFFDQKIKNFTGSIFFDIYNKSIDLDTDGIKDIIDPYPHDPNNSGSTVLEIENLLKLQDSDKDGISDYDEINNTESTNPYDPDSDGDGIIDGIEIRLGSNPNNSGSTLIDTDGDLLPDVFETGPHSQGIEFQINFDLGNTFKMNSGSGHTYSNIVTDAFTDADNDGISNINELLVGTSPYDKNDFNSTSLKIPNIDLKNYILPENGDFDEDGITNILEYNNGTNPRLKTGSGDWHLDSDNDGLSDGKEDVVGSDKYNEDTDLDGVIDGSDSNPIEGNFKGDYNLYFTQNYNMELENKYKDEDEGLGDGLSILNEKILGTNINKIDTDGDGYSDSEDENPIIFGNGVDSDSDGISNFEEIHGFTGKIIINGSESLKFFNTHQSKYDSDSDGLSDGFEINNSLNPLLKDTDNDGWGDGVEINIGYIETSSGNPNDSSIYPNDLDGDGLADEWENYYTNSGLTVFTEYGDFDSDGISDKKEMEIGSDPSKDNYILQFDSVNELISTGECNWSNSGLTISVISPLNLNNLDKKNSGFFTYSDKGTKYDGNTSSTPNRIFLPTGTGYWINNNQSLSSLNGSIVSELIYSNNQNPLGPNKFEITIKNDSYNPHVSFKMIDLISGMLPDPNFSDNESNGFLINQKKNEKDIYLGKSCIDATPPVCGITLSGGNHEQNHGLDIPVKWNESTGWRSLDGTSTGKNLSLLSENSSDETKKFNLFEKIFSNLGLGEKKYFGNFEVSENGYIPWTRGSGSLTVDLATTYSDYYQDNLSGLKNSEVKMLNINEDNNWNTGSGNYLRLEGGLIKGQLNYSPSDTHFICTLDKTTNNGPDCDNTEITNGNTGYSGKRVGIKIFDQAGNHNYCESSISKTDDSFPLVNIKNIIDYKDQDNLGDFASTIGMLLTNKGYTFNIELNDLKSYLNGEKIADFTKDGVNVINGNSGFNPGKDFGEGNLMFCGKGVPSEECTNDILSHEDDQNYLSNKFFYTSTGSTSSGIFVEGKGDIIYSNGVLFEKDAYFSNTGIILTGGIILSDNGLLERNGGTIEISDGTGSVLRQVLFIESGPNLGAYLSTSAGIYEIDDKGGWTPNGINILSEDRMLGENETPIRSGKLAFKIYAKQGLEGPQPGDYFYLNFNFMDRAGNGLPLKYGFTLKENVFAKILGNIQSGQKSSTFDENVQTFEMKESIVKNNVEKIKTNLSNILTNAEDLNGSGILVEKITDLDKYKVSLGDEDIYLIKNGDIILGTGSTSLNLNTGKSITIATYGGNILFNSKYINASENTAFVSLIDPYLSQTTSTTLESQGNILINPELLIGKGQLVAEGSIMSYANLNGKIETIFDMDSRRSIFKNQLIWDGTMISNNTVGGYHQGTCPVSIYGFGNTCGLDEETQFDELKTVSLTYDLHYLRSYIFDGSDSNALVSNISQVSGNLTSKMSDVFNNKTSLISGVPQISSGENMTSTDVIKKIKDLFPKENESDQNEARHSLRILGESITQLFQYPIVIKHSTPTKDMKIFK